MNIYSISKYIATIVLSFIAIYLSLKLPLFNAETIFLFMIIAMVIVYMYVGKKTRYMLQLSSLWGIIYSFVIILLRNISRDHAILIGFPLIVLVTWGLAYIYRKKLSARNILIVSLITLILLEGPVRIINCSGTLISLPSFIFNMAGVLIGNMLFRKHNLVIWSSFLIVFGCAVWMFCQGCDMWTNKVIDGTYTGKIHIPIDNNYRLYNEKGDTLSLSKMNGKIVLLDFWCDGCGVCWQKFPVIQNLYDKYRTNDKVLIAGVFVEMKKGEYEDNIKKIRHKYTFPVFRVSKDESLITGLSVNRFPTVAVLNADGVFRGLGRGELVIKMFNDLVESSD